MRKRPRDPCVEFAGPPMERRCLTHSILRQLAVRRSGSSAAAPAPPQAFPAAPSRACGSYAALAAGIERATGGGATCPVHRLAERVLRGEAVPFAAMAQRAVPDTRHHVVDTYGSRVYGGRFVGPRGERFVTTCQDMYIRVYSVRGGERRDAWTLTHQILCEDVRWTITDFAVSPCGRWLAYATINHLVRVVDLDGRTPQRVLDFSRFDQRGPFGIMALVWSADGREIVAGTTGSYRSGDGHVVACDIETETATASFRAHAEDVNSVALLRPGDTNLMLTGSDDALAKLWDRRARRSALPTDRVRPSGVFIGHCEGLTHVSSKDDGRFFISQGKDQKIKLWDVRRGAADATVDAAGAPPKAPRWDYRYGQYPGPSRAALAYRDDAVMTYGGAHETLQTLIRSYFSPAHSTGQRYIYTGSRNGVCAVYDVLTGKVVAKLHGHNMPVRDISWHPTDPMIVTVSWDHRVLLWATHEESSAGKPKPPRTGFAFRCEKFNSLFG